MLENENSLRLVFFLGVLVVVALWEIARPKRILRIKRSTRWGRNLTLILIDSITVRMLVPFTASVAALYAQQEQLGLLHFMPLPFVAAVFLSVILLDLVVYSQHVVFHHIPILWRLHKVHHIDQDIDVTTGVRFHPVEIIISTLIKCMAIVLLGVPFIAVVIFEILLNATAMFNHGNIRLPVKLDAWLRFILVTPDMHRVHHSVIVEETNSNFGFNLPWWDRIFKTYRAQPANGHDHMTIGLKEYQDSEKTGLGALLVIPFEKNKEVL